MMRKLPKIKVGSGSILNIIKYLVIGIGALIMLFPFYWMVLTSTRDLASTFKIPPELIPRTITINNYVTAWTSLPYGRAYLNSIIVSVTVVIFQLATASLAAYAFAKIPFKGKELIFIIFIATMMIPFQVIMIPTYLIIRYIGLYDSLLALIIPNALFSPFGVFLLRQFFKSIPNDIEEAAIIDGAKYLSIYYKIYIPLIKPALTSLGIFVFLGTWNNFLPPLIFLNSPEKYTIPILLASMKGLYSTRWNILMAAATIAILPVIIVYIAGQKYIVEGIALTGLKG